MSPNKNAISYPCEHAVEGISDHLGLMACYYNYLITGCGMLLQLPHEAFSNYLVVDHVAHSKFDA